MRGHRTTKEEREKIIAEYQNGAKIPNLMLRHKLSSKTIKRIVGIYNYDYDNSPKSQKNEFTFADTDTEKVVLEYIQNRIAYLNEQIIKLSNEKQKLQEFNDYLNSKRG